MVVLQRTQRRRPAALLSDVPGERTCRRRAAPGSCAPSTRSRRTIDELLGDGTRGRTVAARARAGSRYRGESRSPRGLTVSFDPGVEPRTATPRERVTRDVID